MAFYAGANANISPFSHLRLADPITVGGDRTISNTQVIEDGFRSEVLANASSSDEKSDVYYAQSSGIPDLIRIPFGSMGNFARAFEFYYGPGPTSKALGYSSLKGQEVAYPDSWGGSSISTLESLLVPSVLYHPVYGRGVYLGTTTQAEVMPMFVPGSGGGLDKTLKSTQNLIDEDSQPPQIFPSYPSVPIFSSSNRQWVLRDHGGPLAYVFYGSMISPSSDTYKGRAVMQISGGPTLSEDANSGIDDGISGQKNLSPDKLAATAIDAFWPSRRPVLKKK